MWAASINFWLPEIRPFFSTSRLPMVSTRIRWAYGATSFRRNARTASSRLETPGRAHRVFKVSISKEGTPFLSQTFHEGSQQRRRGLQIGKVQRLHGAVHVF